MVISYVLIESPFLFKRLGLGVGQNRSMHTKRQGSAILRLANLQFAALMPA